MVMLLKRRRRFRPPSKARRRRGVFSLSHLATVMFLTVAILGVMNIGGAMVDRNRQQRFADNVAETLGTFEARNMNAVTAQQHLIGELLAMVAIHHAIGGDELDRHEAGKTERLDAQLRVSHLAAKSCASYPPFAFDDVGSPVYAGESLLQAHRRLKRLLTYTYLTKATAAALMAWPPTYPAGEALARAAHLMEWMIHLEWKTLEQIRYRAVELSPLKRQILHEVLPASKSRLVQLVAEYPDAQRQLADQLEKRWGTKIHILPSDRRLPVKQDPLAGLSTPPTDGPDVECDCPTEPATNLREQLAKVSQLSRATFPWVNYHRQDLIHRMKANLKLSRMGHYYFDHTAGVTKRFAVELQRPGARSLSLFVLDDYEGPDKASEPWVVAGNSRKADKSFGLTVLVGLPQQPRAAERLFGGQPSPLSFRMATAFTWNRHAPEPPSQKIDLNCKRIIPTQQALTGWDTLNWDPDARVSELVGIGIPHVFPAIRPQWCSQLSPTSAARINQLREQPLPSWASSFPKTLPSEISPELVGI